MRVRDRRSVARWLALIGSALATLAALSGGAQAASPGANGPIAFMSERSGDAEIWVMEPDGANPRRLTTTPGFDHEPAVSPDGTRIAFTSTRDGDHEIFVMNADGSDQTQLTHNGGFDEQPAFSPDGKRIAFTSVRTEAGTTLPQIYVMDADGSDETRLTLDWGASQPEFSPDGSRIVYVKNVSGNRDIFVTPSTNTCGCAKGTQITDAIGTDMTPSYSPDGARIAFVSQRDRSFDIYTMRPDGTDVTRLTTQTANLPSFSPDGRRIAFESARDGGNRDIYTMASDGSDVVRLTSGTVIDAWPDWGIRPDTTPPAPPTLAATDPASPANANAPLVLGAAEPGSTVRLYADASCGGPPAATGPAARLATPGLAIAVPDDTSTTVTSTATDEAGNVSGCSSPLTYLEDSTPPETTIVDGPAGPTSDPSPTFTFAASETASTFTCRIDDAAFAPCESPHTTAALADGPHTFEVASADRAGNIDPTAATRTFRACSGTVSGLAPVLDPALRPISPVLADEVTETVC